MEKGQNLNRLTKPFLNNEILILISAKRAQFKDLIYIDYILYIQRFDFILLYIILYIEGGPRVDQEGQKPEVSPGSRHRA
jgi:hypothetical protein